MTVDALDILAGFVRVAVGERAEARPHQVEATRLISDALVNRSHVAAVAPTGSGKSAVLLAAAAERVVNENHRVLISTESLSLQKQIVDKDAPHMQAAVRALGGDVTVAVAKGVGNYIDPRALTLTGHMLTGLPESCEDIALWQKRLFEAKATNEVREYLGDADFTRVKHLCVWALLQYEKHGPMDRHSCPVPASSAEWALVSANSSSATPLHGHWMTPPAEEAKAAAANADIVCTNHTMLAIQAAKGVPVIAGSQTFGEFDHILVDEAHTLEDNVANQGGFEVSTRAINSVRFAVQKAIGTNPPWQRDGVTLADAVDKLVRAALRGAENVKVTADTNPVGDVIPALEAWVGRVSDTVKTAASSSDAATMIAGLRARDRMGELKESLRAFSKDTAGVATWLQRDPSGSVSAQGSPVDVSGLLKFNLWTNRDSGMERGVACVSATLPTGFAFSVGLKARAVEYPSPLLEAYERSALFIPNGTDYAGELLRSGRFDTKAHAPWAARMVTSLVDANAGSALILASTSEAGRAYAQALRTALPELTVLSQWDGSTAAALTGQWREDVGSVLVGTRSLMTGTDAPGETNSLVVLDRIPRKPSNALDDARVELLMSRGAVTDKWAGERFVYGGAAKLLEEQAVGRLIRSASDIGMAAVLDPRLLKYVRGGFPAYQEQTRKMYMAPLYVFGERFTGLQDAARWLRERRKRG